jgi:hypothetical protein
MQASNRSFGILPRLVVAGAVLALALVAGVSIANAVEIIPSAGLTRNVDSQQANMFGSLSVRGQVMPLLATSWASAIAASRTTRIFLGAAPVTASTGHSVPAFYAGGGVGWYNITFDYADAVTPCSGPLISSSARAAACAFWWRSAAVDPNGRYVMLRNQDEDRLIPEALQPQLLADGGVALVLTDVWRGTRPVTYYLSSGGTTLEPAAPAPRRGHQGCQLGDSTPEFTRPAAS